MYSINYFKSDEIVHNTNWSAKPTLSMGEFQELQWLGAFKRDFPKLFKPTK